MPEKKVCGHINKQNWNYKPDLGHSVLEDLACDLPAGHDGNHSAEKHEVVFKNGGQSWEGDKRVAWTDAAGTPADQIEPDLQSLVELKEKRERELAAKSIRQ